MLVLALRTISLYSHIQVIIHVYSRLLKASKCRFGVGHLLCRTNTWPIAKGYVLPRWPGCLPSLRTEDMSVIFVPYFGTDVHGLCVRLNTCSFSNQYWRLSLLAATDEENCVLVADSGDAMYMRMEADSWLG